MAGLEKMGEQTLAAASPTIASTRSSAPDLSSASAALVENQPKLNMVQNGFLGALSAVEKVGMGGTAVRLYNDIVQRGRTATITEKDLSAAELESFKKIVQAHSRTTGKESGHIDYKDYVASPSLSHNILGGFDYTITKGGEIVIKDTYDFNLDRADKYFEHNQAIHAVAAIANPRGLAAGIGRARVSDKSGRGVPVEITIR